MDEELLSLSFSVESNKGVYALLLGSGISFSAGIPTGLGILNELCRRIMVVNGRTDGNPVHWYEEKYKKMPLYDEVIEMLAKTSAERIGLLKEFFEPTEEDIKEQRKMPTEAHRAIAKLVKEGYIKVIVTPNFDRLIEQSLDELNIEYQTLYHESDIEGMKPLAHSECTVLKIHGDYRDTRFKNVSDELKNYSEPLTQILKRVFDEYGMIISGWSAEWDTALRDTIKSVKGRRYSWYWHSFTRELPQKAKEIVSFRDASIIIDSQGSDHFFKELYENIVSISKIKKVNPDRLQVKIIKLKDYIANHNEIELRDSITEETVKLAAFINKININGEVSEELLTSIVDEMKEKAKPLSILLSLLAYYVQTPEQERLLIETLERLTSINKQNGTEHLKSLRQIPLQAALYSVGISLVMCKNYKLLDKVFILPKVRDRFNEELPFITYTSPGRGLHELFAFIKSERGYPLPMEQVFIYPFMKEIFIENRLVFDHEEFTMYYDSFEFFRCIKSRYLGTKDYLSGRFGLKEERNHLLKLLVEGSSNDHWKALELCGKSKQKFKKALGELVEDLNSLPSLNGQGLLEAYTKGEKR